MSNSELDNLRLRIDDIDLELSKLITERQSLASKIMTVSYTHLRAHET